jgi:hypothetical protein
MDDFVERVKAAPTLQDVMDLYTARFADLLVAVYDDVCGEYAESVRANWLKYCGMLRCDHGPVIIINQKYEDEPDLQMLLDILTLKGSLVRKDSEFAACKGCGLARPTLAYHKLLVAKDKRGWSDSCCADAV